MATKIDAYWIKYLRDKYPQAVDEAIDPLVREVERLEKQVSELEEKASKYDDLT